MQEPTSHYGCGSDTCVACYGDEEYREAHETYTCDDCLTIFTLADARRDSWTPDDGAPRCPECHSYEVS